MSPSGLVVFLLSVQVIQSQDGWGVTYLPIDVCAAKGSTVEIICTYTHPPRIRPSNIKEKFWFTKEKDGKPVDLTTDSEYSGRVKYKCSWKSCTLIITDVRESDSAEYKFTFGTNKPGEKYTGSPGVTLCVTGPGVSSTVSSVAVGVSVIITLVAMASGIYCIRKMIYRRANGSPGWIGYE